MITDTEIKVRGLKILSEYLGDIEAERFVALIQREQFDYTKWRDELEETMTIEELSHKAMDFRRKHAEQPKGED